MEDNNDVYQLTVDFNKSYYDPNTIKSNLKLKIDTWTIFDYPIEFTN